MSAKLTFLPANEQIQNLAASIYGARNIVIKDNVIELLRKPNDKSLYPLRMGKEELAHEDNVEALANYIMENLNEDFEGLNRSEIIQGIIAQGLPSIYSELGIISDLQIYLGEFSLNDNQEHRKEVLVKDLLPLIFEKIQPHSCVFVDVNIKLQQSIFSLLKVGLHIKEHGNERAKELIEQDTGAGMIMTGGQPLLSMLDAYTFLASTHYTIPVHLPSCSFHFLLNGAAKFTSEMRHSLQNMFQADQSPMLEARDLNYSLSGLAELNSDYSWRYLRFSVDCINNLMSYANNPFNFLNDENEHLADKQMQFFTALYLLYADIASINHTTNKHIQYHLAFGAIEKIANLVLGHINKITPEGSKSPLKERHIAHIIFMSETGLEIQDIIKGSIEETKQNVCTNLVMLTEFLYQTFHEKINKMYGEEETKNIGSFYEFRKFYAHGSFLSQDLFKKTFLKTTAQIPTEVIFIPYALMMALSANPERFFAYFQRQVNNYDYDKFK